MALREGDAVAHLRLKQQMVESDSEAVFTDGRALPVFIYTSGGQAKHVVETGDAFYEARAVSGFVRMQKQPVAPIPVPLPVVQQVDNWVEKDEPVNHNRRTQLQAQWNPNRLYRSNILREVFGSLTPVEYVGVDEHDQKVRYCRCLCKNHNREVVVSQPDLITGVVTECTDVRRVKSNIVPLGPRLPTRA
jgi:hypothetical protein